MKNLFTKKIIKILTGVVLVVFVVVNFTAVMATHIPYQWDYSLSDKENYTRAGHPEFYKTNLKENTKENTDKTLYEQELEKMKKQNGIINFGTNNLQNNNSSEGFTFTLLQPLPTESGDFLSKNVTLKQYLTWAYKFVLALTGFLAVMMIVIGGVEYVISGANESMRGEAHKRIWGAITGLILALVAYLVLYTINPSLVNFEDNWFFKPRNTQTQSGGTNQTNIIDNTGIINLFPKQEGESGIVVRSAKSTSKKIDGENTYNVNVERDAVQYKDGSIKYNTTETYTDKNNYYHTVLTKKDVQGNILFSGEVIDYGGNEGMKFFIGGKEVKQSEFNK